MPYITHQQLLERPGARELAEIASDEHQSMVPYELMQAALAGDELDPWSLEDVESAQKALVRIDDAIADADGLIDGYLRKAGYAVPMLPIPRLVTVWCRAITRYNLHKNDLGSDSMIVRDYKDALKLLQQVADGKLSLGGDDEVVETGAGMPLISPGCRPVRNALKDF